MTHDFSELSDHCYNCGRSRADAPRECTPTTAEPRCVVCDANKTLWLINAEGGYGFREAWACQSCMGDAEPGSVMANMREKLQALGLI